MKKTLEENLCDLKLCNKFLPQYQKQKFLQKKKLVKLTLLKFLKFWSTKETIKSVKDKLHRGEKDTC